MYIHADNCRKTNTPSSSLALQDMEKKQRGRGIICLANNI